MPEQIPQVHARKPYRCKTCAEASQEPHRFNLRVLHVWPLCWGNDIKDFLPASTQNITVLLHAPPQTRGWGHGGDSGTSHTNAAAVGAEPVHDSSEVHIKRCVYTARASNAIWTTSNPIAGT